MWEELPLLNLRVHEKMLLLSICLRLMQQDIPAEESSLDSNAPSTQFIHHNTLDFIFFSSCSGWNPVSTLFPGPMACPPSLTYLYTSFERSIPPILFVHLNEIHTWVISKHAGCPLSHLWLHGLEICNYTSSYLSSPGLSTSQATMSNLSLDPSLICPRSPTNLQYIVGL